MPEELPRAIGPYEITGRIGKGGMGQIYKAIQPSLNRVVAIKVLPPEFSKDPERVERFNREAQAVALLNHPNVVHIIDKDQDGDLLFFVMEYVPGSSLDVVLKHRRLSLPETLRVFRAVCQGLEAAHAKNITHRDLNPRNILVSEDLSTVKLADFGISRVDSISLAEGTLSTSQLSLGSLHYMAPEQARDMMAVDQRSDIYSLGVVLYEMLTGRLPVGRFSLPSQLNSEVPPELDPIVLKCLATNPEDRYPTVTRLLADLGRLEDQLRLGLVAELRGISRSTTRMFSRTTRAGKPNRAPWIAGAAVLVLALAAAGAYLVLGSRSPEPPPAAPETEVAALPEVAPAPPAPGAADAAQAGAGAPAAGAAEEAPPAAEGSATAPAAVAPEKVKPKPAAPVPVPAPPKPAPRPAPAAPRADPAAQELKAARDQVDAKLYAPALTSLRALIAAHPDSPALPDAYLLTGVALAGAGRPEEAMAAYADVRSRFPRAPQAAEAGYLLGKLIVATGDRTRLDLARQTFREVASGAPSSPWAPKALAAQAQVEEEMKIFRLDERLDTSVPAALVTLRQLVETYPRAPEAEKALWELGGIYDDTHRYDLAAAAFSDLGTKFPATRYDAWWRAAQLFDRRLHEEDKAVAAYRRVPATSPHADDAKKRADKLAR